MCRGRIFDAPSFSRDYSIMVDLPHRFFFVLLCFLTIHPYSWLSLLAGFKKLFRSSPNIPSMIYSARANPGTPKVRRCWFLYTSARTGGGSVLNVLHSLRILERTKHGGRGSLYPAHRRQDEFRPQFCFFVFVKQGCPLDLGASMSPSQKKSVSWLQTIFLLLGTKRTAVVVIVMRPVCWVP